MSAPLYELLVERHAFSTQRTLVRVVSGKITAHQTEDGLAVDLARGASPEAPDADAPGARTLHELDQKVQRGSARDEILHEQHARARADEPLELDRQRHAPLAA